MWVVWVKMVLFVYVCLSGVFVGFCLLLNSVV